MNRRRFVAGMCACAATAGHAVAHAQSAYVPPARFTRPDTGSDEGGLWSLMDREEARLRRSPFSVRDPALRTYVQQVACKVGGSHCPDIRVHLVRTPLFNASMAPNGMMQVWTGLLLRVENEAQLAAVLGHEIGHYLERHTLERLRDAKSRLAFAQFLGVFGVAGTIGQLGVLAGGLSYSRDQEYGADRVGMQLMRQAGYDCAEAVKVWDNLLLEIRVREQAEGGTGYSMFATHPPPEDRQQALAALAAEAPGGETNEQVWRSVTARFRREWLMDEVRRARHEESIALLDRMLTRGEDADLLYARGEVYRLRGKEGDIDAALRDLSAAVARGNEPPETHRGLAAVYRALDRRAESAESYKRYLAAAPNAPDAAMIRSYVEELEK